MSTGMAQTKQLAGSGAARSGAYGRDRSGRDAPRLGHQPWALAAFAACLIPRHLLRGLSGPLADGPLVGRGVDRARADAVRVRPRARRAAVAHRSRAAAGRARVRGARGRVDVRPLRRVGELRAPRRDDVPRLVVPRLLRDRRVGRAGRVASSRGSTPTRSGEGRPRRSSPTTSTSSACCRSPSRCRASTPPPTSASPTCSSSRSSSAPPTASGCASTGRG